LSDFSRVTGISVIYTDEAPYGLSAPAVNGQMSATQALQRLLSNTGFTFRQIDARTLALEPVPTEGAVNLGATTISGVGQQVEDSTSYQPPPTSSVMRSHALLLEPRKPSTWCLPKYCVTRPRVIWMTPSPTSAASPRPIPWPAPRTP
jgi:iron complex outermembrane receptor protein